MFGQATFTVKAGLDADGTASAKITVSVPYGSRQASATHEVTDAEALAKLGTLLGKLLTKEIREDLTQQGFAAASEAFTVANNKGEKV